MASTDYATVITKIEALASEAVATGELSGVCVGLVDDQQLVYAKGFGYANKNTKTPVGPDTVFRVGSISKLFTAIAAMQLVEQGKLSIDVPVEQLDPQFSIVVPFADAKPVTLRHLMSHRSGVVRESPIGSYFDPTEPSVADTVHSIAACPQVYPTEAKPKYSNVGVSVVGHVVSLAAGMPFEEYQQRHLLAPLGMSNSSFVLNEPVRQRLATGYMLVADGRGGFAEIEAPLFELGTLPAGNLYSSVEDVAKFVSFLFREGRVGDQALLKPDTLEEMFTPQCTADAVGYGLGFNVQKFQEQKTVSHSGAVYGFTTVVTALVEHKLAVIVLTNDDIAMGPMDRLNRAALAGILQAKAGIVPAPADPAVAEEVTVDKLRPMVGEYESESFWASVELGPGGTHLVANISGQRLTLTPVTATRLKGSGRYCNDAVFTVDLDSSGRVSSISGLQQVFKRAPVIPKPIAAKWQSYLGSYGPVFIPAIISHRNGHLYCMTENMFDYRLYPVTETVFRMCPGMYTDEYVVFQLDANGAVYGLTLCNVPMKRNQRS